MSPRLSLAVLPLALAGCAAGGGDYPSLAPREIERTALFSEPERAPVAVQRDAALDARVAAAVAAVGKGERDFAAALDAVRRAAAGRLARGSDAWVTAQQALTMLDAARGGVSDALGDLDAMRLETAQGSAPVDTGALDAAYTRAGEAAERQRAAYQAEADRLPAG